VTTSYHDDYTIAVENGYFDYLFFQSYNTGESSNRIDVTGMGIDYCNGADGDITYCSEEMPGYIEAGYLYLLKRTVSQ
jgi:hypothetical protein